MPIACGGVASTRRHHPGRPRRRHRHPRKDAPVILEDAKKFMAADAAKLPAAKNGTANRAWVQKTLDEKGFEIIDDVYHA